MNLRQRAIQGTFWSAIEKWGGQLVSTAIFLLLARLLGVEAFGLVALANVFLSFMHVFLDQGFAQAIIQRDKIEPEHLDTAFWTSVLMSILFVLIVWTGAGAFANFYGEPDVAPIVRWMSLSFLFAGLSSVQSAILMREMKFKAFAARSLIATVVCGVVGVGSALAGFGVWSLVFKEIAFGVTGAITLWSVGDWRPGLRFSASHFKELFSFGINIVGFNVLNFFNLRSDDILIGYFLGSVALGYYSVAYRLLLIMIRLLTTVTTQVALPTFSQMQDDLTRIRKAFYKVTRYTSLISFPAFLGIAVAAPELVQCLFGEEWLPSVPVMRVLSFIGILESMEEFNAVLLLSMGKPLWRLAIQFINTVANVIVFLIVVRWGLVAIALALVIRGYLLSPVSLLVVNKLINIDFRQYIANFSSPLAASTLMVATIVAVQHFSGGALNIYIQLAMMITIGVATYTLSILAISPKLYAEVKALIFSA